MFDFILSIFLVFVFELDTFSVFRVVKSKTNLTFQIKHVQIENLTINDRK